MSILYVASLTIDPNHKQRVAWADELLKSLPLKAPKDAARASFLETSVGNAALILERVLQITKSDLTHSVPTCIKLLDHCLGLAQTTVVDDDGCEVLYGRAGLLYSLLRLKAILRSAPEHSENADKVTRLVSDSNLATVVQSIIARGRLGASWYSSDIGKNGPSLMWSWHGKRYLGGAHGVAGILHVLLLCPLTVIDPYMPEIIQTIEWLVARQDEDGNWPSKAPGKHSMLDNELVQWCHGATGFVVLLSTLLRRTSLPDELTKKIVHSMRKGSSLIYRHGFLRKGVGICHGVAGSVFALLSASAAFHHISQKDLKEKTFSRAMHLAHLAVSYKQMTSNREMTIPDRPYSLYEGLAGMCCAWAAVLYSSRQGGSGIPGFGEDFLFV